MVPAPSSRAIWAVMASMMGRKRDPASSNGGLATGSPRAGRGSQSVMMAWPITYGLVHHTPFDAAKPALAMAARRTRMRPVARPPGRLPNLPGNTRRTTMKINDIPLGGRFVLEGQPTSRPAHDGPRRRRRNPGGTPLHGAAGRRRRRCRHPCRPRRRRRTGPPWARPGPASTPNAANWCRPRPRVSWKPPGSASSPPAAWRTGNRAGHGKCRAGKQDGGKRNGGNENGHPEVSIF